MKRKTGSLAIQELVLSIRTFETGCYCANSKIERTMKYPRFSSTTSSHSSDFDKVKMAFEGLSENHEFDADDRGAQVSTEISLKQTNRFGYRTELHP